jgi:hypothetical protein
MYVDLDTGTIVDGPVVRIPEDIEFDIEGMTDRDVIEFGRVNGIRQRDDRV